MVVYKNGIDAGKFKLNPLVRAVLYLNEHKDVTVFPDGSVGSRFVKRNYFTGSVQYVGNVMEFERLSGYDFTIGYSYPLKPNQMPVSKTAYLQAVEKRDAKRRDEALRRARIEADMMGIRPEDFNPAAKEAVQIPDGRGARYFAANPGAGANKRDDSVLALKRAIEDAEAYAARTGRRSAELIRAYAPRSTVAKVASLLSQEARFGRQ